MPEENTKPASAPPLQPPPDGDAALTESPPGEKLRPFSYINYENIKRLAYLLKKEPPQVAAVVLSYLKPEFTQRILAALPDSLKVAVIQESAKVRSLSPEQMTAIDARVKEKVDLVVGGWEQAAVLLENADEKTRGVIFERLRRENPMIYDKLKKSMFRFEDIPKVPFESVRIIIRELKNSTIATALHGASPELLNKFRANMPPGGVQLLLETLQFSTPTPADVQTARKEIVNVIRHLEKEGQVSLDDNGDRSFLGDLDEEEAPMPAAAPSTQAAEAKPSMTAQAAQYLSAGVAHYQGGRFEQSLEYFQYALNCDPSLWQAHQCLGGAFYSLNRMAEARTHYEKLLQVHPDPALKEWYETFKKNLA
ncbi:MAG: FliG C-terminal domain-containing protein [Elusimicrobiota bacterium]